MGEMAGRVDPLPSFWPSLRGKDRKSGYLGLARPISGRVGAVGRGPCFKETGLPVFGRITSATSSFHGYFTPGGRAGI